LKKNQINPKKIFDEKAASYGSWFKRSAGTEYVDQLEKETILKILKSLGPQELKIAELGVGKGRMAKYLMKNLPVKKYFGIDLSAKMTKNLEKIPGVKIIIDDASKFRLKEKVDVVLSIRQIKYNQNYLAQLKRARSCLKKNGLMIIEFPSLFSVSLLRRLLMKDTPILFNPFKLKRQLKGVGFKNVFLEGLRFLPDNCYQSAHCSSGLKIITGLENLFKTILPSWLGKSIIMTAFF
jgi:trans-aconitate methyltransferase